MYYKAVTRAVNPYNAVKYATIAGVIASTSDEPLLVVSANAFAPSDTTTIFDACGDTADPTTCYIRGSASCSTVTIIIAPYPFVTSIKGEKRLVCVLPLYFRA